MSAPSEAFTKTAFYKPLAKASRDARRFFVKSGDATAPSTTFTQPDRLDGKEVSAFVVILRTRGCRWALGGGCTFCGYVNDSFIRKIEGNELVEQFRRALAEGSEKGPAYGGEPVLKIYTSGSFLDPYEVPEDAQAAIAALVPADVRKLNVEAQAPDVTDARVAAITGAIDAHGTKLEIGVGLESSDATVARYSVNKEFFQADFEAAATRARGNGASLKAYTMVKPPYLTEAEAIEDCVQTARLAGPHASTVSFNPMNIQKNTLVSRLWQRGEYRPPWLWSVIEILKRGREVAPDTASLKSDPVAGGKIRGAHNCGACDDHALRAIAAFNVTQDPGVFDGLDCRCRGEWERTLELEAFAQGPLPEPRGDD